MTVALVIVILILVLIAAIFILSAISKSQGQKIEKQSREFAEMMEKSNERIEVYKNAFSQLQNSLAAQSGHRDRIEEIKKDTAEQIKNIGGSTDEEIEAILNSMDDYNNSKL
jgi:predicted Holliday junction resolvase-like endonuclease